MMGSLRVVNLAGSAVRERHAPFVATLPQSLGWSQNGRGDLALVDASGVDADAIVASDARVIVLANPGSASEEALRLLAACNRTVLPALAFHFALWDSRDTLRHQYAFGHSHASLREEKIEHVLLEQAAAVRLCGLTARTVMTGTSDSSRYLLHSAECVLSGMVTNRSWLEVDCLSSARRMHIELETDAFARPPRIEIGTEAGTSVPTPHFENGLRVLWREAAEACTTDRRDGYGLADLAVDLRWCRVTLGELQERGTSPQ